MIPASLRLSRRPRFVKALLWLLTLGLSAAALPSVAVDLIEGARLYANPRYQGEASCATSTCHGADPTVNQNRVRVAANFPSAIVNATQSVPAMYFLRDRFNATQLNNLAAFIADPRPPTSLPLPMLSAASLDFNSINLGTTSAVRIVTLTNTGVVPLQLYGITLSSAEYTIPLGTCSPGTSLAPFASCSMGIAFTPSVVGTRSAAVTLDHNASPGNSTVFLTGIGAIASTSTTTSLIEYRNIALDYYFLTSRLTDIALLDSLAGWVRTGQSFKAYTVPLLGTTGIKRYYFDRIAVAHSRGSHFYTLTQTEKDGLDRLNPSNAQTPGLPYFEGIDSYAFTPLVEGVGGLCATGQTPVYRLFRGQARFPDNPNHRFTSNPALYNAFVALGWDGEGVKFCVPNP